MVAPKVIYVASEAIGHRKGDRGCLECSRVQPEAHECIYDLVSIVHSEPYILKASESGCSLFITPQIHHSYLWE